MSVNWKAFAHWLASYDPATLVSEDDVETKCVLPIFQYLGYPESHRRGKYGLSGYKPEKSGRKPEIDQIYFATAEQEKQTIGQALVIVEAKRTSEVDLRQAIAQGLFYSEHMRSLLLVVTNGVQIIVLHRRPFGPDEEIFNSPIAELAVVEKAQRLLELVSFDTILRQHKARISDLSYEDYIRVEQALRAYPDIQTILAQADFEEAEERVGRVIRIARAKVQIEGTLPTCLGGGSCEISFSHILRRGLRIDLDHADILSTMMVGIGSDSAWDTRHFIERETEETYRVRIGNTETQLSRQEAEDVCACIDHFAGAYREAMMQAEDRLVSWSFPIRWVESDPAFYLVSIDESFWKYVDQFTKEHDWRQGDSDPQWRKFEFWGPGFIIAYERGDHAYIASSTAPDFTLLTHRPLRHLLYVLPDGRPLPDLDVAQEEWQQNIGINGQWTVQQTYQWLSQCLLPEIERRCGELPERVKKRVRFGQTYSEMSSQRYPHLGPVEHAHQLAPYLIDLQRWLSPYSTRMLQTRVIKAAYGSLLNLAHMADVATIEQHYVTSTMASAASHTATSDQKVSTAGLHNYFKQAEIVASLLEQSQTVSPFILDQVVRSLYGVFSDGNIDAPQTALNRTWAHLQPLWRLAQFELRHVRPHRKNT